MGYKLEDLIDIKHFQFLQDKLNKIYSFPSAIIDNEGNVLTATAWQDVCTKFHRVNPECLKECIKSDQYIIEHLSEANPAVTYKCPHGLVDNATPIIIDGVHYGNFFTGQFFLEPPDLEFFKAQAVKYGFNEEEYLDAIKKVPVWTQEQLRDYLFFIKGLIEVITSVGTKNLNEIETRRKLERSEKSLNESQVIGNLGNWEYDLYNNKAYWSDNTYRMYGFDVNEIEPNFEIFKSMVHPDDLQIIYDDFNNLQKENKSKISEFRIITKDGIVKWIQNNIQPEYKDGVLYKLKGTQIDITERKNADDTLRAMLQFNRQVIENMRDGVVVYDTDLRYQLWNPAMEKIGAMRSEEVIGKRAEDLFPVLKETGVIDSLKECLTNGTIKTLDFPYYLPHIDKTGWSSDVSAPLKDHSGKIIGVIATVRDITVHKIAEQNLLENKKQLNNLLEKLNTSQNIAKIGSWEWELTTNKVWWSDETYRIFGVSPDEYIPDFESNGKFIHPDDINKYTITFQGCLATGKDLEFDVRLITPAEQLKYCNVKGKIIYDSQNKPMLFSGVIIDITERKQMEEELRKNQLMLSYVLNSVPQSVFWKNLDGVYLGCNESFARDVGLSDPLQIIGKTDYDLNWTIEEADNYRKDDKEVINQNSPKAHIIEQVCKTDGTRIWVDTTKVPLTDINGKPYGVLGVYDDITERKRAQELLKASEKKFTTLFNKSAFGVTLSRLSDGIVVDVNETVQRQMGLKHSEIVGRTAQEIGISFLSENRTKIINEVKTNGFIHDLEMQVQSKKGNFISLLVSIDLIEIEGEKYLLWCGQDITARIQAENKLKAALSELERFREALDGVSAHIFIKDLQSRYLYANKSTLELFGCSAEELIGKNDSDFFPSNTVKELREIDLKVFSGNRLEQEIKISGKGPVVSNRIYSEIKTPLYSDPSHKDVFGLLGISTDITDKKHAEEDLKLSESRFRNAFEHSAIGMALISPEGKWLKVNKRVCEIVGYSEEELMSRTFQDITHPDDLNNDLQFVYQMLDKKIETYELEKRYFHKNGHIVWVLLAVSLVWDENVAPLHFISQIEDITQRKKAEEELENHRSHLEELVKVRTEELERANESLKIVVEKEKELSELKSRFISITSHEFRTPLTSVRSSAELLQKFGKKWNEVKKEEHFNRIINSVEYLTNLLNDILTLNRTESGMINFNPVNIDLSKFAKGCINEVSPLLTERHQLKCSYKIRQKEFVLDPKLLKFIVNNLLTNAVKYSPDGGSIELNIRKDKKALLIEVSDQGIGILKDDIEKIFDSFFRSKESEIFAGTGLGLAIVKRAVELHKGDVKVESEIGKGTKFTVRIPIETEENK